MEPNLFAMVISIEASLAEEIERRAKLAGVEAAVYARWMLRDAAERPQTDFERSASETLEKNRELYRRLAQGPEQRLEE